MAPITLGLLVMAHGTPDHPGEIESYYTHIRGGRVPPAALLAELKGRYAAIGGHSPLARITREQAAQLARLMNARFPGRHFESWVGFKHSRPFIEEAVAAMHAAGVETALSVVMAPHQCAGSTQAYDARAAQAARAQGELRLHALGGWHREPGFITFWARRIRATLDTLAAAEQHQALVLFSAHSLPLSAPEADIYAHQVRESAASIAASAGIEGHALAWQSAGRTGQAWLGPDVRDVIRERWSGGGYRSVVVCPIGFAADHLEVLYDDDIECRTLVQELGGRYLRPPMPNAEPAFIACLVDGLAGMLMHAQPATT